MEKETIDNFLQNITVIAAVVAIIAATIAPALSALVNKRWEYKSKKLELLFREKSNAYAGFFRYTDTINQELSDEEFGDKAESVARAFLFAPPPIRKKMSDFLSVPLGNSNHLRLELMELMRKDLTK